MNLFFQISEFLNHFNKVVRSNLAIRLPVSQLIKFFYRVDGSILMFDTTEISLDEWYFLTSSKNLIQANPSSCYTKNSDGSTVPFETILCSLKNVEHLIL